MRAVKLLAFTFILLVGLSCKKDKSSSPIQITGFRIVDAFGNYMGEVGNSSDDWQFQAKLSAAEMALFDFQPAFALDNTVETTVNMLAAFPNPFVNTQSYAALAEDSVLLKIVVVDQNLEVHKQVSM